MYSIFEDLAEEARFEVDSLRHNPAVQGRDDRMSRSAGKVAT